MSSRISTDWRLFTVILLMVAFGLVMVYSASSVVAEVLYHRETWEFAARQLAAALVGISALLVLKRMDYRTLQHPVWVFLPLAVVAVLLIMAIGMDHTAHRWLRAPGIQIQPSELAKPALVVFLAWFVARRENKINDKHTLLPAALVVGGLTALIGFGDLGTAAVVLAPAVVVFWVAGIERKFFYLTLVLALLIGIGFLWQKPYRLFRVLSFLKVTEQQVQTDPKYQWLAPHLAASRAARDADHQPKQARLAVGSGGVTGVGLGQSNQKLGFLPEAHTDFIFGVVAEETGLIGCLALLCGYLYVFWRGIRLYWMTPDAFGRYLALGAVSLLTAQALFNMSVVLDMAPTKGIPLPLISYGGSALACTLLTLGLLMSVSDRAAH